MHRAACRIEHADFTRVFERAVWDVDRLFEQLFLGKVFRGMKQSLAQAFVSGANPLQARIVFLSTVCALAQHAALISEYDEPEIKRVIRECYALFHVSFH